VNKLIEITIALDGNARVETEGFQGAECREASRFMEQALGRQQNEQLTAEFYATSAAQQWATEGN
jgi:hypothetical protein